MLGEKGFKFLLEGSGCMERVKAYIKSQMRAFWDQIACMVWDFDIGDLKIAGFERRGARIPYVRV